MVHGGMQGHAEWPSALGSLPETSRGFESLPVPRLGLELPWEIRAVVCPMCVERGIFDVGNLGSLALHRAPRQAFHVIPLQEQVEDDGRETPDEGGGGQHGPLDEPSPVELSS